MKGFYKRFISLIFGLSLYALGIAIMMKANLGFAPWDVFHQGISNMAGITIGNANILVGLIICVIVALAGEKLGLGTILNMLLIGFFLDRILQFDLVPQMSGIFPGLIMMVVGLFVVAVATFFYLESGFGPGPRDGLMVVLERRTGLPVGLCRSILESLIVFLGWLMKGPVGLGTILAAFGLGFCIQITFWFFKFRATEVKHETLRETMGILAFHNKRQG